MYQLKVKNEQEFIPHIRSKNGKKVCFYIFLGNIIEWKEKYPMIENM